MNLNGLSGNTDSNKARVEVSRMVAVKDRTRFASSRRHCGESRSLHPGELNAFRVYLNLLEPADHLDMSGALQGSTHLAVDEECAGPEGAVCSGRDSAWTQPRTKTNINGFPLCQDLRRTNR